MDMKKFSIGIDMDGVLADLDTEFYRFVESNFPGQKEKYTDRNLFFDEFLPSYAKNNGYHSQQVLEKARDLVDFLVNLEGVNLFILTSCGSFYKPKSKIVHDKRMWIEKHFPELDSIPFVITTSGKDKSIFANEHTILIDDHKNNIVKFNAAGGYGLHYSPENLEQIKKSVEAIIA